MTADRVLVTGATGYIGGRLVPRLVADGRAVRVIVRSPDKLTDVPWRGDVEVVTGDLGDADAVAEAMRDVDVVYYLVHSMSARADFGDEEARIAQVVAQAAREAGVRRIVYLGGLHPAGRRLSHHLESRARVGEILLDSGVPTAALQAGVVIGSGSTSFEMIRQLTDRLPYMPAPRWVRNRIQPIAVRDVLYYLRHAADLPESVNRTFDIGGPDVLRYGQMMNGYAVEAGLRQRAIASLPVFTPWLASQWVNLVTPIPRNLAVPIIESLQYDCVAQEHDIVRFIPDPEGGLTSYREAVRLALTRMREGEVETTWRNSSVAGASGNQLPSDPEWAGHTVYTVIRDRDCDASVADLWSIIEGIGGDNGWYSFPLAWSLRGWADRLIGGVGLTRGRESADRLHTGDALDFWRVETIDRGRRLRLRAEMKLPGRAWLELEASPRAASESESSTPESPESAQGSHFHQRAIFFPKGLGGFLYWYAVLPFHGVIFNGMAHRMTVEAEQRTRGRIRDARAVSPRQVSS